MSCSYFEELIAWASSEDLTAEEQAQLDAHLEQCAACRQFAADMTVSQEAVGSLASVPLPTSALAEFRERLEHQLEQEASTPGHRLLSMAAMRWAAVIAMALSVWWWLPGEHMLPSEAPAPAEAPAPEAPGVVVEPASTETVAEVPAPEAARADDPARAVADTLSGITSESLPSADLPDTADTSSPPAKPPALKQDVSPTPITKIATAQAAPTPAPRRPATSTQLPTAVAESPQTAANDPMVVQWISEDPDLVIYWLVDTEPEEEAPSVPSKV